MLDNEKQKEFLRLLLPVRDGLYRWAQSLTRNREDARDLVSETIMIAYSGFEKLRKKESFKSFLFTVAIRVCRKTRRRRSLFSEYDETLAENLQSHDSQPDLSADVFALYEALDTLPKKQRETVVLFEISGLTLEEIKVVQGGTLSGVKSRLVRGRQQLANILVKEKTLPAIEFAEFTEYNPNFTNSNYANSNYTNSGYANSGYANPGYALNQILVKNGSSVRTNCPPSIEVLK